MNIRLSHKAYTIPDVQHCDIWVTAIAVVFCMKRCMLWNSNSIHGTVIVKTCFDTQVTYQHNPLRAHWSSACGIPGIPKTLSQSPSLVDKGWIQHLSVLKSFSRVKINGIICKYFPSVGPPTFPPPLFGTPVSKKKWFILHFWSSLHKNVHFMVTILTFTFGNRWLPPPSK